LKHERHPSFSHKEMVLWALRGYWMAIAFQQRSELGDGLISKAQMQQAVLDGTYQLRQQIVYLQANLGVSAEEQEANAFCFLPEPESPLEPRMSNREDQGWDDRDLFESGV
jgi:hypothetical protein